MLEQYLQIQFKIQYMNKLKFLITIFIALAVGAACAYKGNPHGSPPGQAKKVAGSQSAKPFAPGQQKKNY